MSDRESLLRYADNRDIWRNLTHRFPHPYTAAEADAWFAFLAGMPEPSHWAIEVDGVAVAASACRSPKSDAGIRTPATPDRALVNDQTVAVRRQTS